MGFITLIGYVPTDSSKINGFIEEVILIKVTGNKARVVGNKVVQDITYRQGTQQTKVTVERNSSGGNPRVTGMEKKSK